jgi:hypothetical protein
MCACYASLLRAGAAGQRQGKSRAACLPAARAWASGACRRVIGREKRAAGSGSSVHASGVGPGPISGVGAASSPARVSRGRFGSSIVDCRAHALVLGMKTDRIRTNITDIIFVFIFMSGFEFEYE